MGGIKKKTEAAQKELEADQKKWSQSVDPNDPTKENKEPRVGAKVSEMLKELMAEMDLLEKEYVQSLMSPDDTETVGNDPVRASTASAASLENTTPKKVAPTPEKSSGELFSLCYVTAAIWNR